MAEINAQLVKQLRERTGAGMMECKKALVATNGDLAEAEVVLRKQGIAGGQQEGMPLHQAGFDWRAHRSGSASWACWWKSIASPISWRAPTIFKRWPRISRRISPRPSRRCEVEEVTEAERANFKEHEALYEQKFAQATQNTTVGEFVKSKIAKLGENIDISRFADLTK